MAYLIVVVNTMIKWFIYKKLLLRLYKYNYRNGTTKNYNGKIKIKIN